MKQDEIDQLPEIVNIAGQYNIREVKLDGVKLDPKPSQKFHNHSPDGFNWGYGGSGPAQLALAIMLKYLPEEVAANLYQAFKFDIIASLPQKDFTKTFNLREWVGEQFSDASLGNQ